MIPACTTDTKVPVIKPGCADDQQQEYLLVASPLRLLYENDMAYGSF